MNTADLLRLLEDLSFHCGMNVRYSSDLAAHYETVDFWIRISVLVAAGVSLVASILSVRRTDPKPDDVVRQKRSIDRIGWGTVSVGVSIVTLVISGVLNGYPSASESCQYAALAAQWQSLREDVDVFKVDADNSASSSASGSVAATDEQLKRYKELLARKARISASEPPETDEDRLKKAWRDEHLSRYGLERTRKQEKVEYPDDKPTT